MFFPTHRRFVLVGILGLVLVGALFILGFFFFRKPSTSMKSVITAPEVSNIEETSVATLSAETTELAPPASATPSPTPKVKSNKTTSPLIECRGPDGKTAKSTQEDCDNLNDFWKKNTPVSQPSTTTNSQQTTNTNSSTSQSTSNVTPSPTPTTVPTEPITVSASNISATLSRSSAQNGMIYAPGMTITSNSAHGFQIKYNEGTQGQGFETSSGGMSPGSSTQVRIYINPNKPNGTYAGSAVVEYSKDGSWHAGPTVSYSITLVD